MEEYKGKLLQVFNYAKALNEVRNPIITNIDNQRWHLWLRELPVHKTIDYLDIKNSDDKELELLEEDYILRVSRPILTDCPEPPEEIKSYIEGNWKDVNKKVDLKTSVVLEEDDQVEDIEVSQEIKDAFDKWLDLRNQWLITEQPASKAMDIFKVLYKLYSEIDKESETVELVLGDAILKWQLSNGRNINHPILIQQVELVFDPQLPEFKIILGNKNPEIYSSLWKGIEDVNPTAMAKCIEDMNINHYSVVDKDKTDEFLNMISTALSSEGSFSQESSKESLKYEPLIVREQVLFLRKRNLGFSVAFESILSDIEDNENIPTFLKRIVGFNEEVVEEISDNNLESINVGFNGEDEDILFTKPSNPEQLMVAKHLEKNNAVLVQGPPGTGKTHTIANLVGHLLAQGKSILITSYSDKALKVLRDKIVAPLKPLCLPVFKGNKNIEELEKTLDAMNERRSTTHEGTLNKEIISLDSNRRNIIRKLKEKRQALKNEINNEYVSLVYEGEEISPKEAAKYVFQNKPEDSWIPSPVVLGSSLTLTGEEIKELYKTNTLISEAEEQECILKYPQISSLIRPLEFQALVGQFNILKQKNFKYRLDLWKFTEYGKEQLLKNVLEEMQTSIKYIEENSLWSLEIIQCSYKEERLKEEWITLYKMIEELYEASLEFKKYEYEYAPTLQPDTDKEVLKNILQDIEKYLKEGKKLTKLKLMVTPKWTKALGTVKVNGKSPEKFEEIQVLLKYIDICEKRSKVVQRFDRQVAAIGGPSTNTLGEYPEVLLIQHASYIKDRLYWYENKWKPLESTIKELGFYWDSFIQESNEIQPQYSDLINLKKHVNEMLPEIIEAQLIRMDLQKVNENFNKFKDIVQTYEIGEINKLLQEAVETKSVDKYEQIYNLINRMYQCGVIKARREELLQKLRVSASKWAEGIRFRTGSFGDAQILEDITLAWKWRQLNDELDRRSSVSIEGLQTEIKELEETLRGISIQLADKKAWLEKLKNITLAQTQAIEGWKLTMKSIGAGTGKRVPMLLAKARELATQCQTAVPVWIMPLSRVVENFNPKENKFDVVIIDEASQADILAISALYMGKQVVIVGDDEQVSPLAVGTKIDDMQNLIDTYLYGIPNSHLFTPQFSIYDLARTAGFQPICLKEHFRCVAPIIQFSNHLSYKGAILPLRDESSVTCTPPLVNYRVECKTVADKTNYEEAEAITSLIMACMQQPEYNGKTFGVISLLGEEQARIIEEMLQKKIEPSDYKKANLLCGTSAQFQGDERDIIFISLVNTAEYGEVLNLRSNGAQDMMKKRYNVAVSRAGDQLWVVHSLDSDSNLKEGDLRLRLIRHAQNPYGLDIDIENLTKKAESEFEVQVIKILRQAGYKVVPQWKVGSFRIDMVIEGEGKRLAVECDGEKYHGQEQLEDDMKRQAILERLGWTFTRIRGSKFFRDPEAAMKEVFNKLEQMEIPAVAFEQEVDYEENKVDNNELLNRVKAGAELIRRGWMEEDKQSLSQL